MSVVVPLPVGVVGAAARPRTGVCAAGQLAWPRWGESASDSVPTHLHVTARPRLHAGPSARLREEAGQ